MMSISELCSHGRHLRNLSSLHLSCTFLYSTSSASAEAPPSMVDYMIKNLGFSEKEATTAWSKVSESNVQSKRKLFQSFGWSDTDITTMVRKSPRCLLRSEAALRSRLEFFMHEMGFESKDLASHCGVFHYSLEARLLPRFNLLKVLDEKKLLKAKPSLLTGVCRSEPEFLKRYVLPYKDEVPESVEAYLCKMKGTSAVEAHNSSLCFGVAAPHVVLQMTISGSLLLNLGH